MDDDANSRTDGPEDFGEKKINPADQLRAYLLNAGPLLDSDGRKTFWNDASPNLPPPQRDTLGVWLEALAIWSGGRDPTQASPQGPGPALTPPKIKRLATASHIVRIAGGTVPWDAHQGASRVEEEDQTPPVASPAAEGCLSILRALLAAKTVKEVEDLEAGASSVGDKEAQQMVEAYALARQNVLGSRDSEAEMTDQERAHYQGALVFLQQAEAQQ